MEDLNRAFTDEDINDNKLCGYSTLQLTLSNLLLERLNKSYGTGCQADLNILLNGFNEKGLNYKKGDLLYTIDKLKEEGLIEASINNFNDCSIGILPKGREVIVIHGSFRNYIKHESEKIKLDKKIKELTVEHLNRSIFKQKHAWLYIVINIIVTIGVALLTAYLVFKFGWK
ncbi:hypothetical protein L3073_06365 [Ancylomarina sp. DW003]|nr:hypothetical protein [Ancylomarina sp. DW003]MDE5421824.1 hypothetical protein [Ancylomarina sp. DW003]